MYSSNLFDVVLARILLRVRVRARYPIMNKIENESLHRVCPIKIIALLRPNNTKPRIIDYMDR